MIIWSSEPTAVQVMFKMNEPFSLKESDIYLLSSMKESAFRQGLCFGAIVGEFRSNCVSLAQQVVKCSGVGRGVGWGDSS